LEWKLTIKERVKKIIKLQNNIFLKSLININNKKIIKFNKKKAVLSPEINIVKKYKEKKIDNFKKLFFKLYFRRNNNKRIKGKNLNKKLPKTNSSPKKLEGLNGSLRGMLKIFFP
jgi:hypothetical protein